MPQVRGVATVLTANPASPDGLFRRTDCSPPRTAGFYRLLRQQEDRWGAFAEHAERAG